MRLTLRTLLAWLDDMLPAEEVREIGRQVDDSPLARELVDRIQRVSRQRRLASPASSGPDATDPNLVAEYLDGSLTPEQVVEFEKKCLTSDVHLAEVASVHQILSLLGQRAQVPEDARHRMYHLVRGPETMPTRAKQAATHEAAPLVAARLPDWQQGPRHRNWRDLVKPLSALAGLLLLLGLSAWWNLKPLALPASDDADTLPPGGLAIAQARPPQNAAPPVQVAAVPSDNDAEPQPNNATDGETEKGGEAPAEDTKPAVAVADNAKGRAAESDSAVAIKGEGLVVHPKDPEAPWGYAKANDPIEPGSLVANLDPFQSQMAVGPVNLVMQGATTLEVGTPAGAQPPPLNLLEGRLVMTTDQQGAAVQIAAGAPLARVQFGPQVHLGAEVLRRWTAGMQRPATSGLTLYVSQGDVQIQVGNSAQAVHGPAAVTLGSDGKLNAKPLDSPPEWVIQPTVAAVDAELGRQLARFFREGQRPVGSLVEATTSDQPELRALALDGLGQLNQLSLIVQALNIGSTSESRRAAIATLRKVLARGEPWLSNLRKELADNGDGESYSKMVEGLLVGFPAGAVLEPDVRDRLIEWLTHPDRGIRELVLDDLMRLTARGDEMGYDPDKPTDAAVEEWRRLLTPRSR